MGTPLFTGDVFQWARFCNVLALKKMEIRVYEKTTTSVINNVSAYSTDSITPDFSLRKGYRFLIRCHSRLQTFSKQRCDSSLTVIFISVFNGAFQISLKMFFRTGKLSTSFGSDRLLFQKQGLLILWSKPMRFAR